METKEMDCGAMKMKIKAVEIKEAGIRLVKIKEEGIRLDGIRVDGIKILSVHVSQTRADEIKILNEHVSQTVDRQMNLKVVQDRDNAHPKISKEPFKLPARTIKMERPQHKQFNLLLTFISQLEPLARKVVIAQFNSKMPISWLVSHKEEAFSLFHMTVFMSLVSHFVSTEDVMPHYTCTSVSITKTSSNGSQSVT